MAMNPPAFERIELGTYEPCPCSPEISDDFRGLAISTPSTVSLERRARLPLCGIYQVGSAVMRSFASMDNEIVVVAVDARSHIPRAANLLPDGFTPEPSGTMSDEDLATSVVTGWFNIDLFETLADLPREPATYYIFSTVGGMTSNVVTVQVVAA